MNKFTPFIFLIIIFTTLLIFAVFFMPPNMANGEGTYENEIEYFGYYYAFQNSSLMDQVSGHSNTIIVSNATQAAWASQRGFNIIVQLSGAIWEPGDNGKQVLKDNWQTDWGNIWNAMSPHRDSIIAFYITDEPDINVNDYNEFIQATNYIKTFLINNNSNIATMAVFTYMFPKEAYLDNSKIPSTLDWVAFDEYHCYQKEECYEGISYADKLDWIVDIQRSRGKKVLVIFNGFVWAEDPAILPTQEQQDDINNWNDQILSSCISRGDVCIGGLSFLFETQMDSNSGNYLIGVQDLPEVLPHNIKIGTLIKSGKITNESTSFGENIAIGKNASASNSHPLAPPSLAVNGDINDGGWNAGSGPVQEIIIDLGEVFPIKGFKLYTNQSQNGESTHEIYAANSSLNYRYLTKFDTYSNTGEIFVGFSPGNIEDVRYLKIKTTNSLDWVSWNEIEIFYPSLPGDANGDGLVNNADYTVWANHYQQPLSGASNGDFNQDNFVDGIDYAIWLTNYE